MALERDTDRRVWVCIQCGSWTPARSGAALPGLPRRDLGFDLALDRDLGGGCVTSAPSIADIRQERLGWLVMSKTAA
jgi:hypothetical protein